ncbi:MAG TPA: HEAT repeat domain-containing protein, partial [Gemmatimonadales bacterium]|nr:HEAT repeat domain-containing protein [Gemmatimonadales bacterium]
FFSGHVYPKGAQTAHQLRRLLGDSLFWAGMHRFLVDNEFKPVTTRDFAIAFEKVAHRDLDWFFDQWCYGIGYPKVDVTRHWDPSSHTLAVTVRETQPIDSIHPFFRFPTTIRIVTADSVVRQDIMVTRPEQTFNIVLPGDPLTFRFDEGGWLLGTVHTDQTPAELAEMARHDLDFAARNWALHALEGSTDSSAVAARQFIVLNEHEPSLRALALSQLTDDSKLTHQVVMSALADQASDVRAGALRALAQIDSATARREALRMYRNDPSTYVHAVALTYYARLAGPAADSMLVDATAPGPLMVRQSAVAELGKRKGAAVADALAKLTDPTEPRTLRSQAIAALARVDNARAAQVATQRLGDYDPLFAVQAVRTLARTGGANGKATLRKALKSETRVTVKAAISQALAPKTPEQQGH